jgi:serine protease inhibitor
MSRSKALFLTLAMTTPTPVVAQEIDSTWTRPSQAFTIGLFRDVVATTDSANIVLSPLGVELLVGLAANGARGETQAEMFAALGRELDVAAFNRGARELLDLTQVEEGSEYSIANSVWVRDEARLRPQFGEAARRYHHATLAAVDFSASHTVDRINQWANEQTNGRIPVVVQSPLRKDLRLLLLNAVYFKGDWARPFDPKATAVADFTTASGTTVPVHMMSRTWSLPYASVAGGTAIQIPYESDRLSAFVILPDSGSTARQLVSEVMTAEWLSTLRAEFRSVSVHVRMPRFEANGSFDLEPSLERFGIHQAFTDHADFGNLAETRNDLPLKVGDVSQRTFLKVDEVGTEAAAVTGMTVVVTGYVEPIDFTVNRPFLFIVSDSAGAIPFIALIGSPTRAN